MIASADFSQRLMSTFLVELEDHARAIERGVLALERGEGTPATHYAALLRAGHSLKGAARVIGLDAVEAVCHRFEEVVQALRDGRKAPERPLFQLLLGVADALSQSGRLLGAHKPASAAPLMGVLPKLAAALDDKAETETVSDHLPEAEPAALAATLDSTLRVAARKLDTLLAQDGELLVARRRAAGHSHTLESLLQRARDGQRDPNPAAALRDLTRALQGFAGDFTEDSRMLDQAAEKLSAEIRLVRMLPFAQACEGLERLVRDLTSDSDKEAALVVSGGDIGVDRSVLEGLRDPLMHLVRNAVDHGIEPKSARRAAYKAPLGRISVSASLVGPQLVVTVRDDGRGIDRAAVAAQMTKRGLTPRSHDYDAIFEAGFSTQESVSRISGRGVGLDVVKSQIEDMRGVIQVESEAGKGAVFTLSLPLTLTAIRGLLVRCGNQTFALDSTMVRGLSRVTPEDVRLVEGRAVLVGEGDPLPFADLASLLNIPPAPVAEGAALQVVLLGASVAQAAIAVDALVEEDDLTVRNLGPRFGRLNTISGGTILPDGRVALILHAADLIAAALEGKTASPLLAPRSASVAKKRLLIAEDSLTTRTLIKAILENAGYEVNAAQDGAEAFRLLEDKGADLVVADVEMPEMDGFTLAATIRAHARYGDLPVILLTALESDRDKARGLAAGANAYLVKSAFDQRELISTIRQMV